MIRVAVFAFGAYAVVAVAYESGRRFGRKEQEEWLLAW